jgi:hypothetical protein
VTVVVHQREPLELHQVVGRTPGCGAQRASARRFLLQQGLSLHTVCAYEPVRFLREGVNYLRRYYRQEWDSSWDEYWTQHRLERHRRECLAAQELSSFGARMRTEHRQPTLADIYTALDRGRLVWVSVDNNWGEVDCHAVLVYGQRGNRFDVYSPEVSGNCLQQYRRRRLDGVWLRSEGMTAVGCAVTGSPTRGDEQPGVSPAVQARKRYGRGPLGEAGSGEAAIGRDSILP